MKTLQDVDNINKYLKGKLIRDLIDWFDPATLEKQSFPKTGRRLP
jgi:hypothetical protein